MKHPVYQPPVSIFGEEGKCGERAGGVGGRQGHINGSSSLPKDKDMFTIMLAFRGNGGNLQPAVQIREKNIILLIRNWTTQ